MGLSYPSQRIDVLVGTKSGTTRTGVELESTYSETESPAEPTRSFETGGFSKLSLDILYNMGAAETANSIEMKVESSPDRTNWYRLSIDTTATQSTLTAREWTFVGANAAAATINIILDIAYDFMRISFKETGVVAAKGNVYVEGTLSGQ